MDDTDDDLLQERITASFAKGIVFTDEDLLQIIDEHSLEELALIVVVFQSEAFAVLRDPDFAQRRMLELVVAFHRFLAEDAKSTLAACINETFKGYVEGDGDMLLRLPMFDYELRGDRVAIEIIFPDEHTA